MNKYLFVYKDEGKYYVDLVEYNAAYGELATETAFSTEAQATVWAMEYGDKYNLDVRWDITCYEEGELNETVSNQRFTKQSA